MENVIIRRNITVMVDSDIMKAMDITEQIASEMGFLPRECLFLRLATEEACMNAYEYCQKTNQLPFEVFWKCGKEKLVIVVKQHGKKFDITRRDVVNKGSRGRGLQLIIHIVDHVYLEQKGNNVLFYMCKYKDH
ncbi:serine/threonine-protein kinase RsbW [Parageobacillus thermantarcticus]|uniref:Serine/threonine-protein kinase RsbW n=1 Tax=Parageobacillus thermantarcticus TaxID=186116 RepID=A0A1I0TFK8_9BACL|nr:ATP-binding protein [Parageobacillus thermantarcticus]SFA50545.1 serine/threonine-protein kinase RsbW [Parageobacillus thermantarcticus]